MRLATFNVLHGRAPSDGRVNLIRFATAIRTLDADVLALQEVDRYQPRSFGADITALAAEAMEATAHRFVAALSGPLNASRAATGTEPAGTPGYGIALLSRYPMVDWRVLRLPALRLRVPIWTRRRPRLVRDEARVAMAATVESPVGRLLVVTTHLSFLAGWREVQLSHLWRALGTRSGPLVLMGDLNMRAPWPERVTRLQSLVTQPTFPTGQPQRQIDHILAREVHSSAPGKALHLPVSDHRALVVDVEAAAVG